MKLLHALLLAIILVAAPFAAVYFRGTSASAEFVFPESSSQGVRCELFLRPDMGKQARCAAIVDMPKEAVWTAVTDYQNFDQIFSSRLWSLRDLQQVTEASTNKTELSGKVATIAGDFPMLAHITHSETPELSTASWDERGDYITVNRGQWSVRRLEEKKTLLVYDLDVAVRGYPEFLVRSCLLSQIDSVILAVKRRVEDSSAG